MPDGKTYDDNTLECAEQMKKCYKCFRAENLRLVPDSMLQILGDCGLTPSCASSVNPPCGSAGTDFGSVRRVEKTNARLKRGRKPLAKVPPPKAFRSVLFLRVCYSERPILMTACMPPVELTTLVTPLRASTSRLS